MAKAHPLGFCICKRVLPAWNRPTHWSAQEVSYLEQWYGRMPDDQLSQRLGRPLTGIRLKAKRLRVRKRDTGLTATAVARIFGIDPKGVMHWITAGLLPARRSYAVGPNRTWHTTEEAVEEFIRDHGQYVDVDKMPEGWYRDLAENNRWYSLPEVEKRVGQSAHLLVRALKARVYRGAKRGPRWYVAAEEIARIAETTDPWRRQHLSILKREREERLQRRRDKRKGIGRFRLAA